MTKIYNLPLRPRLSATEPKYPGPTTLLKVLQADFDRLSILAKARGVTRSDILHELLKDLEK